MGYPRSSRISEEESGWNIAGSNIGQKLRDDRIATTLQGDPAIRDAGNADLAPWGTQGRLSSKIYRRRLVRDRGFAKSRSSWEHVIFSGLWIFEMDLVVSALMADFPTTGDVEEGSS